MVAVAFAPGPFLSVTLAFAADLSPSGAQLAVAIKSGQRATAVEMIAKKSADVNAAEADGSTPLLWAANLNDPDLVSRLLKGGRESQGPQSTGGSHAARDEAAFNACTEMIKALLDGGADPNAAGTRTARRRS